MRIDAAEGSDFFVDREGALHQMVMVDIVDAAPGATVHVTVVAPSAGRSAAEAVAAESGRARLGIPVPHDGQAPGERMLSLSAEAGSESTAAEIPVRYGVPGWSLHLVPHFHYDPVWWNTQGSFVSDWETMPGSVASRGMESQVNAFELMRLYLDKAAAEPDFSFVVSEVDYLKPWWAAFPHRRKELLALIRSGRVEVLGGSFNEPQTNLVSTETTIRSAIVGMRTQKDLLGGDPRTAWQLDVFGHDPQYPGIMSQAGLTSTAWARGPFHEWGPMLPTGGNANFVDPEGMQFPSEFLWMSPSGRGLLTSYMTAHYFAGWWMHEAETLEDAEWQVYDVFRGLQAAAATRTVMLPVGMDHAVPNRWVTAIADDWSSRFVWPRVSVSTPRDYFDDVEADTSTIMTQTRDMNPLFSGTHVSFIDTKQAHRAGEHLLGSAEVFAALAARRTGVPSPHDELDLAWRQLVFAAHHDAITGSESDQVYIDLLGSWREAWTIARDARQRSLDALAPAAADGSSGLVVLNSSGHRRSDVVAAEVPLGTIVVDDDGAAVPMVRDEDGDGAHLLASDIPALGYRSLRLAEGEAQGWTPRDGTAIANDAYVLEVDPARGGAIVRLVDRRSSRELVTDGGLANEVLIYHEYPNQPLRNELGPWYVSPKGPPVARSRNAPATVVAYTSPVGERIVVAGTVGSLRYEQTLTLWSGSAEVDCRTVLKDFAGADQLVRISWACDVPGALPLAETGAAVIGRGFAHPNEDAAVHARQYDAACYQWFGLGATARLRSGDGATAVERAIAVAEIISPSVEESVVHGTELAGALVRRGVTSSNTLAEGLRYGDPAFDSNSPDVRFAIGTRETNAFVDAALAAADSRVVAEYERQIARGDGSAVVLIPAAASLRDTWKPGAAVTGLRDLPVVVATDAAAVARLCEDLEEGIISLPFTGAERSDEHLEDYTVALFNRGTPNAAVDTDGTLYLSVLRSCTGWPSGLWLNPPTRTAPDGSGFQLQHWTHTFEYAFAGGAGDWRQNALPRRAHDFNRPLFAHRGTPERPQDSLLELTLDDAVLVTSARELATGELEIRASETTGRDSASAVVIRGAGVVTETDVLGEPTGTRERGADEGEAVVSIAAYDTVTLRIGEKGAPAGLPPADPPAGPAPDATQLAEPQPSRYWLGSTGAAPIGDLPVAVVLCDPRRVDAGRLAMTAVVSREAGRGGASGTVRLAASGDARLVGDAERPFDLGSEDFATLEVILDGTGDGTCLLEAVATFGGERQRVVDSRVLRVADASEVPVDEVAAGIDIGWDPEASVTVGRGERRRTSAVIRNRHAFPLRGRVQILSPWESWEWVSRWSVDVWVEPFGESSVPVDISIPMSAGAGATSWLLAKFSGSLGAAYGPALAVSVE